MGQWGPAPYRPGGTRSWRQSCKRPCNDLTAPRRQRTKRPLPSWLLATLLWGLACSSRRLPRERGLQGRPRSRWCWWRRPAALASERHRHLAGTVAAADLYHPAGHKGPAQQGGQKSWGRRARGRRQQREPGRGQYDKDRPAMSAWGSRQGTGGIQAPRDGTVKTVPKAAGSAVRTGRRLSTASASSSRAVQGDLHACVQQMQKEDARGEGHENRAAGLVSLLTP
jgi:hypothetical protein